MQNDRSLLPYIAARRRPNKRVTKGSYTSVRLRVVVALTKQ